jgi:hypothetical protein
MYYTSARILLVFFSALLIISCSENPFSNSSIVPADPSANTRKEILAQEILVSDSRFDRPYTILGSIETTQKNYITPSVDPIQLRNQAITLLKQEAYSRYGDKVNGIIDTQVQESTLKDYDGPIKVTRIRGVAVAFNPEIKPIAKRIVKRKATVPKITSRKVRPSKNTVRESQPEDIEITPSEILK